MDVTALKTICMSGYPPLTANIFDYLTSSKQSILVYIKITIRLWTIFVYIACNLAEEPQVKFVILIVVDTNRS